MKCRLIILTILSILYCKVYGQAKLCIVGTIHNPTAKINSDSIFEVIKKFSPTIILYEADTILDIRNDLKGIDGGNTNEFIAINKNLLGNIIWCYSIILCNIIVEFAKSNQLSEDS
ncbi:MAG: hypothetical protein EAZ70_10385, partial [Runella slithyformis]